MIYLGEFLISIIARIFLSARSVGTKIQLYLLIDLLPFLLSYVTFLYYYVFSTSNLFDIFIIVLTVFYSLTLYLYDKKNLDEWVNELIKEYMNEG
jgi:hypothetical protein